MGAKVIYRDKKAIKENLCPFAYRMCHEASIQDYNGGKLLLAPLRGCFPRLELIWADSGYNKGGFVEWVKATFGWEVEIVEHPWSGLRGVWAPKDAVIDWEKIRPSGFHVLPHRWISSTPSPGFQPGVCFPKTMRCSPAAKKPGSTSP